MQPSGFQPSHSFIPLDYKHLVLDLELLDLIPHTRHAHLGEGAHVVAAVVVALLFLGQNAHLLSS